MKRSATRASLGALLVVLVWIPVNAQATQVLNVSIEKMARESAVIIRARVEKQRVEWSAGSERILTLSELTVLEGLKGAAKGDRLTVYQVGGELEGMTLRIPGALSLTPGEEMVFFGQVFKNMIVSYGMGLGKYRIQRDGKAAWISPDLGEVNFVKRQPDGTIVQDSAPDTTRKPLADFLARLRRILKSHQKGGAQ